MLTKAPRCACSNALSIQGEPACYTMVQATIQCRSRDINPTCSTRWSTWFPGPPARQPTIIGLGTSCMLPTRPCNGMMAHPRAMGSTAGTKQTLSATRANAWMLHLLPGRRLRLPLQLVSAAPLLEFLRRHLEAMPTWRPPSKVPSYKLERSRMSVPLFRCGSAGYRTSYRRNTGKSRNPVKGARFLDAQVGGRGGLLFRTFFSLTAMRNCDIQANQCVPGIKF